jgi:hypothetical protein
MSVVVNEFEVTPAAEQRSGEPEQKPAEAQAPPSPAEVERLLWVRAERAARLEAD